MRKSRIKRIEIARLSNQLTKDSKEYVRKKIGKLDVYLPEHSRESAHAEVKLKQNVKKNQNQYFCEVVLHLPNEILTVHESTISMEAAVDIVEAKLKNQIKKYKDLHAPSRSRHLFKRLIRRSGNQ